MRGSGEPGQAWGRLECVHLALLLLLTCVHWLPRLQGPIDLRYDAGVYFVLGTSLAEGTGYRLLNEPGEIHGIQYPPLLPAWVALHQLVLDSRDPLEVGQALRWSSALSALVMAGAIYAWARRLVSAWPALLTAVLATLSFHVLYLEDLLFTEVPFALVSLAFLLAQASTRRRLRLLAAPLAAAAFFLRSAGVALFGAWMLEALVRRRWKSFAGRTLVSAGCVLAWQGYVAQVRGGPEYAHPAYEYQRAPYLYYNVSYAENMALLDPFRPEAGALTRQEMERRLADNLSRISIGLGECVSTTLGFWEWSVLYLGDFLGIDLPDWPVYVPLILLSCAVLFGLYLLLRRGALLIVFYVAASMGLIALLPWPAQIPRYVAPLAPLLALSAACSLAAVARRSRILRAATVGLCLLVFCMQAFALKQFYSVYRDSVPYPRAGGPAVEGQLFVFERGREWREFYRALGWLADHSPADAVVATSCPHLAYIHTGRHAVMPPFEASVPEAQRLLDGVPVDYVIVDDLHFIDVSRRYAGPVMATYPELWEPVYEQADGPLAIYRRRR